jgi:hypothetical protein
MDNKITYYYPCFAQDYIFQALYNFTTKFCNFTMFFLAVVFDSHYLLFNTQIKNTGLNFNPGLVLIVVWTTGCQKFQKLRTASSEMSPRNLYQLLNYYQFVTRLKMVSGWTSYKSLALFPTQISQARPFDIRVIASLVSGLLWVIPVGLILAVQKDDCN